MANDILSCQKRGIFSATYNLFSSINIQDVMQLTKNIASLKQNQNLL